MGMPFLVFGLHGGTVVGSKGVRQRAAVTNSLQFTPHMHDLVCCDILPGIILFDFWVCSTVG